MTYIVDPIGRTGLAVCVLHFTRMPLRMNKITRLNCCVFVVAAALAGLSGCNKTETPAQTQAPNSTAVAADSDPSAGNLAPVADTSASTAPEQTAQNYAPDSGTTSYDLPTNTQDYPADYAYDTASNQPPIEATEPPPPLPQYDQPPCPGDGYYWTPGYWGYANSGYYWVPGVWVLAPWVNALWTPPYWDYEGGNYLWHAGYWGPHIGFYGGIDYGFGYTGRGYYGAYWNKGQLTYNREVTNVVPGVIGNVYGYSVPRGNNSRVSYNGGRGGIDARPTPQEMAVVHDPRTPPVAAQVQHARQASGNRAQFASAGHAPEALAVSAPLPATYKQPAAKPPAAAMRMAARPAPAPAAAPRPENRAVQENRPAPQSAAPPARGPEVRQEARPESRPAPQVAARPVPQQQRPAPEVRPVPQQQRPAQEARPAPAPQRPAQEARPAPAPQRPAQEARPAPAPRPAPEVRPAPQRPEPVARPAAPPSRPAPPVKPEDDKKKG
jgi:hypothetical protein